MTSSGPPRRGRPARISRATIVATAEGFHADDVTMEAVARELGVDRKALHYHVGDRDGLLSTVAADLFLAGMTAVDPPPSDDWRVLLRSYAKAVLSGYVRAGSFSPYVSLSAPGGKVQLQHAELLLQALVDAGLTDREAGRAVALVTEYVYGTAMETVLGRNQPHHPQLVELEAALAASPPDELPVLKRVLAGRTEFRDDADVEYALDVITAGLDALMRRPRNATS